MMVEPFSEDGSFQAAVVQKLRQALADKSLVILVGAGVTLNATSNDSHPPPRRLTWTGLIEHGLNYLESRRLIDPGDESFRQAYKDLEDPNPEGLLRAAGILTSKMDEHGQFATWLEFVFRSLEVRNPELLHTLRSLHSHGATLLTTNYDNLLERSCGVPGIGRSDLDKLLKFKSRQLDGVLHVHGSYHEPGEIVLDSTGYYQITQSDEVQNILRTFLEYKTILFTGCGSGLEDPNFGCLLNWAEEKQKNIPNRHCLLLRETDSLLHHKFLIPLRYGTDYGDLSSFLLRLLPKDSAQHDEISKLMVAPPLNLHGPRLRVADLASLGRTLSKEEKKCLHALYPGGIKYEAQKNQNPIRVPDTCLWALRHPAYLEWRSTYRSRLLWISADAGCGKSVLSRAILDEDLVDFKEKGGILLYFFFKDTSEEQRSATRAISSMLHQLFVQNVKLLRFALNVYLEQGSNMLDSVESLWRIFTEAVRDPESGQIICVLDALDECNEGQIKFLVIAIASFYQEQGPPQRVRFLITSRPYLEIRQSFAPLQRRGTTIALDGTREAEDIKKEIDLVIRNQVRTFALERIIPPSVAAYLEETLLEMQQRTYLWLRLIWDLIRASWPDDIKQMEDLISHLPDGILEAYEKLLRRCPNQSFARKVLGIVLVAAEPLTLEEMDIALHIDDKSTSLAGLNLTGAARLSETLPAKCGHMVSIVNSKIYFIHQTVKDFLVIEVSLEDSTAWQHSIDPAQSHRLLATTCLQRLLFFQDVDRGKFHMLSALLPRDRRPRREALVTYSFSRERPLTTYLPYSVQNPFLYYAATYWADHCQSGGEYDCCPGIILDKKAEVRDLHGNFLGNALEGAAIGGHRWIVKMLLEAGADVNTEGCDLANALRLASSYGHIDVVQLLIEAGAGVNLGAGDFRVNALTGASRSGHIEIVRLLIEAGADVNAKGVQIDENALAAAISGGHTEIIQLLIEGGVDVNARGGDVAGSALAAASREGHTDIVRLLIEKGFDVWGANHATSALAEASREGHTDIVRLLIEKGFDIWGANHATSALVAASRRGHTDIVRLLLKKKTHGNTKGHEHADNALLDASCRGHVEIARLLINAGANVNAGHRFDLTALQLASEIGHDQVVELLLAAGADVNLQRPGKSSALTTALIHGYMKVAEILRKAGAEEPSEEEIRRAKRRRY